MLLADGYNLRSGLLLKGIASATEQAADKIVGFHLFIALLWTGWFALKNTAENHMEVSPISSP